MTSTVSVLSELLKRVEGLKGPSRELDSAIWRALVPPASTPPGFVTEAIDDEMSQRPKITGGISQAIALMERVCGDKWTAWQLRSRQRKTRFVFELSRLAGDEDYETAGELDTGLRGDEMFCTGHGSTAPLAIVACILKAKLAETAKVSGPVLVPM